MQSFVFGIWHLTGLFTIPLDLPFLDCLAKGLLREATYKASTSGQDPRLALADQVIFLPTQRAINALEHALLRQHSGQPLLLPTIHALGDHELPDDELQMPPEAPASMEASAGALEGLHKPLPQPLSIVRRLFLLERLIAGMPEYANKPAMHLMRLAEALGRLLDSVHIEQIDLAQLGVLEAHDDLALPELAEHWQDLAQFLAILHRNWPQILDDEGASDPILHRNALFDRLARHLSRTAQDLRIIIAGSTGSQPATRRLIEAVAALPQGAVILPGFDHAMDPDQARAILDEPTHPQHLMTRLVRRMNLQPGEVQLWDGLDTKSLESTKNQIIGGQKIQTDMMRTRQKLMRYVMLPSSLTPQWARIGASLEDHAFDGIKIVEAPSLDLEARAIALAMREILEQKGQTAALVTPNRVLARRVQAELLRWDVYVDDSAGSILAGTPAGVLFRLVSQLNAQTITARMVIGLLRHPLILLGGRRAAVRSFADWLELKWRKSPPGDNDVMAAIQKTCCRASGYRRQAFYLAKSLAPFQTMAAHSRAALSDLLMAQIESCKLLCAGEDPGQDADRPWTGEDGHALGRFLDELLQGTHDLAPIDCQSYPSRIDFLLQRQRLRTGLPAHPRLSIQGPLEARLQHVDLMILGGLNEQYWPARPAADPWLSRAMRNALGLAEPEVRIGQRAHDFAQGFAAPGLLLTRSKNIDDAPAIASRWLLRLQAVADAAGQREKLDGNRIWLHWAETLELASNTAIARPPAPKPATSLWPKSTNVTAIGLWMLNPYGFYVKHILHITPLDPLINGLTASLHGTLVHKALEQFYEQLPDEWPPDQWNEQTVAQLSGYLHRSLAEYGCSPSEEVIISRQLERIAIWIVEWERNAGQSVERRFNEMKGEVLLKV
ncbi:MAG: double-strand break repair protein AddB, partial [Pseudomonadota bacterium]